MLSIVPPLVREHQQLFPSLIKSQKGWRAAVNANVDGAK